MTNVPAEPIKAKVAPFGGSNVVDCPAEIPRH
jgi:putative transposon-encoded protein